VKTQQEESPMWLVGLDQIRKSNSLKNYYDNDTCQTLVSALLCMFLEIWKMLWFFISAHKLLLLIYITSTRVVLGECEGV